jgi:hypothetical protein
MSSALSTDCRALSNTVSACDDSSENQLMAVDQSKHCYHTIDTRLMSITAKVANVKDTLTSVGPGLKEGFKELGDSVQSAGFYIGFGLLSTFLA